MQIPYTCHKPILADRCISQARVNSLDSAVHMCGGHSFQCSPLQSSLSIYLFVSHSKVPIIEITCVSLKLCHLGYWKLRELGLGNPLKCGRI